MGAPIVSAQIQLAEEQVTIPYGTNEPKWESPEDAAKFGEWLLSFQNRPLDFVLTFFPWGVPKTTLEKRQLEEWQLGILLELQQDLTAAEPAERMALIAGKVFNMVHRWSIASGHGIGKTAFVAMVIHWFTSVYPRGQAIITASTESQLHTKTWRELAKWQSIALNGWMFDHTATSYKCKSDPELWFATAQTWSDANPSAFAGTHEKYVLVIFDEASGISSKIYEAVEGAMTTGKCFFFLFGNPIEGQGGFYDSHHSKRHRWKRRQIDARTVSFANVDEINGWADDYGEDSDFFRTRVKGMFPKQATAQFIGHDLVEGAVKRKIDWKDIPRSIPRLMGVDVARQGDDGTCVILRQGRKMSPKIHRFKDRDLMRTANFIARLINELKPDIVYIDGVGIGAGVVDRLIQMGYDNIVEVQSGSKEGMDDREKKIHANLRSLMWTRVRDWLPSADIPDDKILETDLTGPTYDYQKRTHLQLIEDKATMKKRGLPSPDTGDALAATFAEINPVKMSDSRSSAPEAV